MPHSNHISPRMWKEHSCLLVQRLGQVWVGGALLPTMPFPSWSSGWGGCGWAVPRSPPCPTPPLSLCPSVPASLSPVLGKQLSCSSFFLLSPELPLHPGPWGSLSEDPCLPWPLAQARLNSSVDSDLQGSKLQPQPNSEACVQQAVEKGAVSLE